MYENLLNSHTFFGFVNSLCQQWLWLHQAPILSGQTYRRASGRRTLTQKQRHLTVWRREACLPLCLERAAGWFLGPGDTASRWGSSVCLLSGCTTRKHAEGFVRVWWFAVSCCQVIKYVTWLHFHHSALSLQMAKIGFKLCCCFTGLLLWFPVNFWHIISAYIPFLQEEKNPNCYSIKAHMGFLETWCHKNDAFYSTNNMLICELYRRLVSYIQPLEEK